MSPVATRLAALAVVVLAVAGCQIPSPLTYPSELTPPTSATAEVHGLLGNPPPPATTAQEAARHVAERMTRLTEGCEVLQVAQVVWVAPTEPATAAVELRGLCDDAVEGVWYELTLEGDDQLGWVVATATRQDICARGVSGGLCV